MSKWVALQYAVVWYVLDALVNELASLPVSWVPLFPSLLLD